MKSKFFGLSAKLALAILAVGTTMTSCYDSENVDIIAPDGEPDPAKYVIVGNVTDGETGEYISGADVQITTPAGEVKTYESNEVGAFVDETFTQGGTYVVTVDADGYKTATRTIYLQEAQAGGVSVGNADFALYGPSADELPVADRAPQAVAPSVAQQVLKADENILSAFAEIGLNSEDLVWGVDENGNPTVSAETTALNNPVGQPLTVTLPYFTGFASDITEASFTKALTDADYWNAAASRDLNRGYGLTNITRTVTFTCGANESISGYSLVITFNVESLSYLSTEGNVWYQIGWVANKTIDSHDNHDSHDSHNGHGTNNGAGGGNNNLGY